MSSVANPNQDFIDFWNSTLVDKFNRYRHILREGMRHHSDTAFQKLKLPPGSRVLDVGCGWGDTSLVLARLVGPSGTVVGIDCCDNFLQTAREDAKAQRVSNVEFTLSDVQSHPFEPIYDLCFSRFGTMFFANPVAALRNMRKSLKPGGQLMIVVWRMIEDNPWFGVPKEVVLQFLPPPGDNASTCGPGPFSMASESVVSAQLKAAGYVDFKFERVDGPVEIGNTPEEATQFQLALGPAGEIFREAGEEAERHRQNIEAALRDHLARYMNGGKIVMNSSSWVITARNPGG